MAYHIMKNQEKKKTEYWWQLLEIKIALSYTGKVPQLWICIIPASDSQERELP